MLTPVGNGIVFGKSMIVLLFAKVHQYHMSSQQSGIFVCFWSIAYLCELRINVAMVSTGSTTTLRRRCDKAT